MHITKSRLARAANAHLTSPTARFAAFFGALAYVSYAQAHDGWTNPWLIGAGLVFALALPYYAALSNLLERRVMERTALVTPGRAARLAAQFVFNLTVMEALDHSGLFPPEATRSLGGAVGVAALITAASQGAQFIGLRLARRGVGEPMRNVQWGLSANIAASAAATLGLPWIADTYMAISLVIGVAAVAGGIVSDIRSRRAPNGGIAVYFGTFNPVHRGHLACVRAAFERRGVERVIIHPTIVPRGHVDMLARGHIRVAGFERGYQVYEKTRLADPLLNYFPTGDRFLPPETRRDLISAAVDDMIREDPTLAGRIEVAWHPEAYAAGGFGAVLDEIARRFPGSVIHAVHGTDAGGMMVRGILDDHGGVYPLPVRRIPGFSGTDVRDGATDETTPSVARRLAEIAAPEREEGEDERLVA